LKSRLDFIRPASARKLFQSLRPKTEKFSLLFGFCMRADFFKKRKRKFFWFWSFPARLRAGGENGGRFRLILSFYILAVLAPNPPMRGRQERTPFHF
jgi:hypothetical protein